MTILEKALNGNFTKEMLNVAENEGIYIKRLIKKISKGEVVIYNLIKRFFEYF